MAQYKCKICGYVFDEDNIEEGLNIANGTKFEDLPNSFKCPKCRMSKGMFQKIWIILYITKIKYYINQSFNELIGDWKLWQNLNVNFADM